MISELRITDPTRTCIKWWESVPWLKGRESIPFEPGLNILWGPNGSGKTTVIQCIARMLHAEQGGVTCPTGHSTSELFPMFGRGDDPERNGYLDGAVPIHDGEAAMHFDPMHAVGLSHGGAAFDWDFSGNIEQAMFKGSSGQTTLARFNAILNAVITHKWPHIDWSKVHDLPSDLEELPHKRSGYDHDNDRKRKAWLITNTLRGTLEPGGPRTILLDEPDRSLDLAYQWGLWHRLAQEEGVQMIIASHSLVALGIKGANYIEVGEPGYLAKSHVVLDRVVERAIVGMAELTKETRLDILTILIKRTVAPKSHRDPRVDPKAGDLVRIAWKGGVQLREVIKVKTNIAGHVYIWWKPEEGKGGCKIGLASWRKLMKTGTVLAAAK